MSLFDFANASRRSASAGLVSLADAEQTRIQQGKELKEADRAAIMGILTKGAGATAGYAAVRNKSGGGGRGLATSDLETPEYSRLRGQVDSGRVELGASDRVNLGPTDTVNLNSNSGLFSSFYKNSFGG